MRPLSIFLLLGSLSAGAGCGFQTAPSSVIDAQPDAGLDAPSGEARRCDTDDDCANVTSPNGKYVCAYSATGPWRATCANPIKTCIFVSSLGRGVHYAPECGCDGRNVEVDSTWPAASAPVASFARCPVDAAAE